MRKFILAALMALPLSILTQQRASADGCGACCFSTPTVGFTFGCRFKLSGGLMLKGPPPCGTCCVGCCGCGHGCGGCGDGGGCPGPWYTYWPVDAHFQTPAPTGYPYWPSGMSPMMNCANYGPPAPPMAYGYGPPAPPMAYGYGPPAPPMAYGYGPPAPPMAYGYGPPAPPMAYGSGYGAPPMAAGSGYGPPPPPMALPMGPTINYPSPASVQPCGYTPSQAPSYWYGR